MATSEKLFIPFSKRGLPGLLLIALGLLLSFGASRHSAWSAEVKHLAFPLALLLAVGGGNLVSSYVRQRSLRLMKIELLSSAVIIGTLWLSFWGH